MGLLRVALRRSRVSYEGVELGGHYPEPWLIRGKPFLEFWWRFWLGRPMDNEIRTNATFWRSATTGYPSWWLRLAGWQRLALRLAGAWSVLVVLPLLTLTLTAVLTGWERSGTLTMLTLAGALPLLIPGGALMLRSLIRERGLVLPQWERVEDAPEHSRFYERWAYAPLRVLEGSRTWEREVVLPLARALAPQLHRSYHPDTAGEWVKVPKSYTQAGGEPVEIYVPHGFSADPGVQNRIVRNAASRLSCTELQPRWELSGEHPRLLLSAPVAPPETLTYSNVALFLAEAKEYEPFLGQVAGGEGLSIQMVGDGPHTALSAGTGAGKTTLLKLLTCQFRHWGWMPIILDWKRSEANSWAWDLPGVRVLSDIEKIHKFGVQLAEELDYRRNASPEERAGLPRIAVIRNEWNATAEMLMTYWQDYRASLEPSERSQVNPKSPAIRGYSQLVFCGRELNAFDIVESQRLSARVFNGNADVRENYRNILMARYTYSTVRMLVNDPVAVRTFPKAPKEIGRWVVRAGEEVHKVQVPYLTNEEARAFALSGAPPVASPWSVRRPEVGRNGRNSAHLDSTQGNLLRPDATGRFVASVDGSVQLLQLAPAPARQETAKLSEMVERLAHLGITINILRNASRVDEKGDPNFPPAIDGSPKSGYRYEVNAVTEWARRRHARIAAEKGSK